MTVAADANTFRNDLFGVFLKTFGDWSSLDRMLYLQLGENLEAIVAREGMKTVVLKLFKWAESNGKFPDLVKGACRFAPANRELWALAEQRGWAPESPDAPGEAIASVRSGLRALVELLREPEVREALSSFRAAFEGAERRIHAVGDYKDLHDRLHDLQVRCYSPVLGAQRDFPSGDSTLQIKLDGGTLDKLVRELRAIVRRPTLDPEDFPWIEDQLEPARILLHEAVAEEASQKLNRAVDKLRDVVQIQPPLVDALLLHSVRNLDLPALCDKLRKIHAKLRELGAEPGQLEWFESGVADLNRLESALKAQVTSHRAWQAVDNDLHLFQGALVQSFEEQEATWRTLESKIRKLCEGVEEAWSIELLEVSLYLADALKDHRQSAVFTSFSKLYPLATDRFYLVDKELKGLCEQLRPIGSELETILEMLQ